MYSVPAIIDIARVSQYMVANDQARRGLLSGGTDPRWARMLHVERGSVQWAYEGDPTLSTLEKTAYYVYALCGKWAKLAVAAMNAAGITPGSGAGGSGGGSVINPETGSAVNFNFEYLIEVKGSQFATATAYNDPRIVGHSLVILSDEINRSLEVGTEWGYTDTGIEILIDGFDALTTHAANDFKIYIKDPDVYAPAGSTTTTESGGTAVAFEGNGSYEVLAGHLLESVVLLPGSDAAISIGTTLGGSELMPAIDITAADGHLVTLNLFARSGRVVYFTGVPAGSTIVFFTKEVNLS